MKTCKTPIILGLSFLLCGLGLSRAQNTETATGYDVLLFDTNSSDNNTGDGYDAIAAPMSGNNEANNNTAIGNYALADSSYGKNNTAIGSQAALYVSEPNNSEISANNTAVGFQALAGTYEEYMNYDLFGSDNTAVGALALTLNATGAANTALGYNSLGSNTSGNNNTALGLYALYENSTGSSNTGDGNDTLYDNTTGSENTALGADALGHNTTASDNTAEGPMALYQNTTGSGNTASGSSALLDGTTAIDNTAYGYNALNSVTTGSYNVGVGVDALSNGTGQYNVAVGYNAGSIPTAGNHDIDIGAPGVASDTSILRIGVQGTQDSAYVAGIYGATAADVPVLINSKGLLGTMTSSARFKRNIRSMGNASDALMALRPVTFQYKPEIDPAGIPQFGLVAEEVEKVDPDLVVRDDNHQIYTVRYDAVNAMLLNEVQKEHAKLAGQKIRAENQDKTIAEQQQQLADQEKLIESLAAKVDKLK